MQKTLLILAVLSALASTNASASPSAPTSAPERVAAWNGARIGHAGGRGAASPKVVRRHLQHRRRLPDLASLIPGLNLASSLWAGEFTTIPVTQPAERSSSARSTRSSENGGQRTQSSNDNNGRGSNNGDQRRTSNRASSTYGNNGNNNGNTQSANDNNNSRSRGSSTSRASSSENGGAGAASTSASRTRSSSTPTSSSSRAATTVVTSTESQGATQGNPVVTSQVSVTGTPTSEPAEPQPKDNHTGVIAGVSTAGGVVLLAIIGVVVAKLFGRRIVRSFRHDEIKWPEMQQDAAAASAPLPARQTGGAGFDMGGESDDEGHEHTMHDDSFKPAESFGNGSLLQGSAPAMQPVQYPVGDMYMQGVGAGGADTYTTSYAGAAPPTTQVEGLVPGAVVSHTDGGAPHDATGAEVPAALQPAHVQQPSAKGGYAGAAVPQQYLDVDQNNSFETYSQATDQHGYPVSAIADVYGDAPPYAETETHYGVASHDIYDTAGSPYEADAYVPHSYANSSAHHYG